MQGTIAIARNWAETLKARKLSVAMVSGIGLGLFINFTPQDPFQKVRGCSGVKLIKPFLRYSKDKKQCI